MNKNIAIDGPAGAGKSTIAKQIAKELSCIYVDTGAMYRAMALYMIKNKITGEDTTGIEKTCQTAQISIEYKEGEQLVYLNGEDVSGQIRTWTSLAPAALKSLIRLAMVVPLTMESSTRTIRLPATASFRTLSFI